MKTRLVVLVSILVVVAGCGINAEAASKTYYVSTSGDNSASGLAEKTAWRTITHAAKVAGAGDTVKIKGGNYGHEHVVIKNSGTKENYITFKGYDGEVKINGADVKGYGIWLNGKSYITIDGITTTRYLVGILGQGATGQGSTHHINVYNVIAYQNHHGIYFEDNNHHINVRNCKAYNNVMHNFLFRGVTASLIEDCVSYADPALIEGGRFKTDYGFTLYGKKDGTGGCKKNILKNCVMLGGPWHGFALRYGSSNNMLINCRSYDTRGEHFSPKELSGHNTFINCVAAGVKKTAATSVSNWSVGFNVKSSNNRFINCIATDVYMGIYISLGSETWDTPHDNLFKNCIVTKCKRNWGINLANGKNNILMYNDVWDNVKNYVGCTPGAGDISKDPLFANPSKKDFHLKSQYGRWDGKKWVKDKATSPCIDAGDPKSKWKNESAPNGGRVNIGAYGNTSEASKSSK